MQRKPDTIGILLAGAVVAAVGFVWFFGGKTQGSAIAIIRTEEIAKQLGWDVESETMLKRQRANLQAEIARERSLLQADIAAKVKEYGENPTPAQQETITAMQQQMMAQARERAKRGQQSLQQIRNEQMNKFRNDMAPVIMKLAAENEFTLILDPTMSNLIFYDQATDITAAVIKELKANALGGAPAPADAKTNPPATP